MIMRTLAVASALVAGAGMAAAQGFEGAEISAEVLGFSDDFDLGEARYAGGVEFSVAGAVGVGANLAYHGIRGFNRDGRNVTVHGLYDTGLVQAGLFYGRDSIETVDGDMLGLEAATDFGGARVDGALGLYDLEGDSGQMLSARGSYDFGGVEGEAFFGRLTGDLDATRISLGGAYALNFGPSVFAELGRVGGDGGSGNYISVGARIAIGPNRGTTFENRGVLEILPGF
jgi:hypothetical protein